MYLRNMLTDECPHLKFRALQKYVEVSLSSTSDIHFRKVYQIPGQKKNPLLPNYNAGKDPKRTCM